MVESNFCHLTSEEGPIDVKRLKTADIIIQSEGGDISLRGTIQGSISIITGDGSVASDKRFLGPTLNITTDMGDFSVSSCYCSAQTGATSA